MLVCGGSAVPAAMIDAAREQWIVEWTKGIADGPGAARLALYHRLTTAMAESVEVVRVRGDMRALPFDGAFDAATSFFTSFGYFDDDGNRAALASIARAIRTGGTFLLDFLNAVVVETGLVPESREERDGRTYNIRRRIEGGRVLKDVTIEEEGLKLRYSESVRLYSHHELVVLLKGCGLSAVASYGAFDGRDFTTDAPRCILVARKTRAVA